MKCNLIQNAYPPFLIDKIIKKYLDRKFSSNQNQLKNTSEVSFFKLPWISNPLHHIKNKLLKLCKWFCEEYFNIKLVFSSFKIQTFSYKDLIPDDLKSFLVCKVIYASCSSSYIGENCRHLKLRNISKRITGLIFLNTYTPPPHALTSIILFFKKLSDKANFKFDIEIKETLHINWRKPN